MPHLFKVGICVSRERERERDTVILASPEKTSITEDSLYRTVAHTVIPLNGK